MNERQLQSMISVACALVALSTVVAIGQLAGGSSSPLYFYGITNNDSGVGLFANRNHQALFLSCGFPLLAAWAVTAPADARARFREFAGLLGMVILIPMLLSTGSRAGIVLGLAGLAFAAAIYLAARPIAVRSKNVVRIGIGAIAAILLFAAGFVYLAGSRALTLSRFASLAVSEDQRVAAFGTIWRMIGDFFPFGTGFGTFDPVYRMYEPASALGSKYLNQAHNDVLDVVLSGGLPAAAIALALLVWLWRHKKAFARRGTPSPTRLRAMLALAIIVLVLASSLIDYPLRTPAFASFFALACAWLSRSEEAASADAKPSEPSNRQVLRGSGLVS